MLVGGEQQVQPLALLVGEEVGALACEATARRVRLRGDAGASVAGAEIFTTAHGNTSHRTQGSQTTAATVATIKIGHHNSR